MLIIALPHSVPSGEPSYEFAHLEGTRIVRQDRAVASLLSRHVSATAGIIPHTRLSWFDIDIPPIKQRHQLMRVIESVLEDKLLQDVQQLHIVAQVQTQDLSTQSAKVIVAVCDKQWLTQALAPLENAGILLQRLLPELCPTPSPELHITGSEQDTECLLTHPSGVTVLPGQSTLWPAFGVEASHLTKVYADPALASRTQDYWGKPPLLSSRTQRWYNASQGTWDLAQGQWAQTGWSRLKRMAQQGWSLLRHSSQYTQVRSGLVVLVIIYVLGIHLFAWRQEQRAQDKREQLALLLKQTFPSVTLVVDPQLQMQRELDALRQTHGGLLFNDFEPLLQNATTLMTSANQKPTSIDYSAHQLKIKGIDPDTATLHRAQAKLNEQRLQVQLDADGNLTLWAGGTP